jgi:hypothetical protein
LHVYCTFFLVAVILLAPLAIAQKRAVTVPFRSVNGMIVLDAQVNNKPAALLLDTGARYSIVDKNVAGFDFNLKKLRPAGIAGSEGGCIVREVQLSVGGKSYPSQRVCIVDLSDAVKRINVRFDGLIGQDVLQDFPAVRIDYKASVVEFEK